MTLMTPAGFPESLDGWDGIEMIMFLYMDLYREFATSVQTKFDWDTSLHGDNFWHGLFVEADECEFHGKKMSDDRKAQVIEAIEKEMRLG